jgi:hypothetical protein
MLTGSILSPQRPSSIDESSCGEERVPLSGHVAAMLTDGEPTSLSPLASMSTGEDSSCSAVAGIVLIIPSTVLAFI